MTGPLDWSGHVPSDSSLANSLLANSPNLSGGETVDRADGNPPVGDSAVLRGVEK